MSPTVLVEEKPARRQAHYKSHQRRGSRTGPALLIIIMIVFWSDFQHILVGGKSANASAPGLCTYYNLPQA